MPRKALAYGPNINAPMDEERRDADVELPASRF
jgi:hypothetical protein